MGVCWGGEAGGERGSLYSSPSLPIVQDPDCTGPAPTPVRASLGSSVNILTDRCKNITLRIFRNAVGQNKVTLQTAKEKLLQGSIRTFEVADLMRSTRMYALRSS